MTKKTKGGVMFIGFMVGVLFTVLCSLAWDFAASLKARRVNRRNRKRKLSEAERFKRASYLALYQHNNAGSVDRLLGIKR